MDSPPSSTFRKYSSTNCTVGIKVRLTPVKLTCSNASSIPWSLRKTQNSSSSPASLSMMHLFNRLSCIQCLRYFGSISPGDLPLESFLHHTCFLAGLFFLFLALHVFLPLPCSLFLQLPTFPPLPSLFHRISYHG